MKKTNLNEAYKELQEAYKLLRQELNVINGRKR
jgi:hypothetical protein